MSMSNDQQDRGGYESFQTSDGYNDNNMDSYNQGNMKHEHDMSPARSRSRSPIRRSRSRSRSPNRGDENRPRRINLISKRVIISNVPYEMKWQDIKDIFRKEVGEVAYVEMWDNQDGKSRGAGIIEFKDKDTARKAIETMHRYKMKDRNIVVREERESDRRQISSNSRGGGGGMNQGGGMGMGGMGMGGMTGGISQNILNQLNIDGPVSNNLFVSNLDYKVTWKKLKDVFKLAGNVLRAEIKQDKEGKSRGIGTVAFEYPVEAVQAISMFNNQVLYDRPMRVKMDQPPGSDRGSKSNVQLPSGLKSIGMGLGIGGQPAQGLGTMGGGGGGGGGGMSGGGSGFGMGGGNMGMGGGNMGMGGGNMGMGGGNMGSSMDNNMGMGMGNNMGNTGMSNMGMGMGNNMGSGMGMSSGMGGNMGGSSMGMGSGMSGTGNIGTGMGMSGGMGDNFSSNMGSGSMTNTGSYGSGSSMGSGMGDGMRGMDSGSVGGGAYSTGIMSSSMGGGNMGGTGGYLSSYTTSDGRSSGASRDEGRDRSGRNLGTRPDNCTVVVKNLPWSLNWQTLRDKFRAVSDVKYAEIKTENGKSQGWGLVRFGSADEAQRAISAMNRTRIDGREIDVKLYR